MRRREVITFLGSAVAVWPFAAQAQPVGKVHRVGLIITTSPASEMAGPDPINPSVRAFVHGLRDQGYVEGYNLVLERRSAEGRFERFGEIVAELVDRKVDVIVATGIAAVQAAKRVTSAVPIVMAGIADPVEDGIVASLARPGGNITGFTIGAGPEIEAKRLQLLKAAVPEASRIAFLGSKSDWELVGGKSVRAAAIQLGITLVHAEHTPNEYADAFAQVTRERSQALFVARNPANFANRQLISHFALEHRLPGMYPSKQDVEAGGLMSYGTNLSDIFRRAAGHVDKILKGAKPADLAVQQPVKFEMVLNMKTAKALGLAIPPLVLAQADEVIE